MCGFAYCVALMVYQFGMLFTGGGFGIGTVFAIVVLAALLFQIFRPMPNYDKKGTETAADAA
jgi:ferrous iron transport protein B